MIDRVDHGVQRHEHESFAQRHLQADVLVEVGGHHAGGEEAHHPMGRRRLLAEKVQDAEEVVDVLELLHRLAREEARGIEIGRCVQPMPALDAGHLAVEELVHHPAEQLAIPHRVEARAAEVKGHLLARQQHAQSLARAESPGIRQRLQTCEHFAQA